MVFYRAGNRRENGMKKYFKDKTLMPPFKWEFGSLCCGGENLLTFGDSNLLDNDRFYNQFKKFVEQALNEKYKREKEI